ncbi:MAG: hypothetical protein FWH36_00900 [Lentimicrobiaceae bacterium]|nr:hypothetical protein [Lentimicrobiaceae bacterium]
MKGLVKILSLVVCIVLLCTSCKKTEEDPKREYPLGLDDITYTDLIESITNSYFQVGDSIYNFSCIRGLYYSYSPNNNVFSFILKKSFENSWKHSIDFDVFTEELEPEIFFQKDTWKINTVRIGNNRLGITEFSEDNYYDIHSVFTWDTVFYENRRFQGKGSFEIMDTLYMEYPDIYYPPQKIEFEFK